MLNYDNEPIIRHAILKKLDSEPNVKIVDINIKKLKDGIGVEVVAVVDAFGCKLDVKSRFDLQPEFYLIDVHNQIDEIAEQCKVARRRFKLGLMYGVIEPLTDRGLRYQWR